MESTFLFLFTTISLTLLWMVVGVQFSVADVIITGFSVVIIVKLEAIDREIRKKK